MAGDDVGSSVMIEVDPKLFITCRLCLEEMGVYQIVPTVQQQIKYCFEINVEPFDGLPQLLCKKCKLLLDDYSSNKKKFIDKQETLIKKLKTKQVQLKNIETEAADSVHNGNSDLSSRSNSINNASEDIRSPTASIQVGDEHKLDSDDNIKLPLKNSKKRGTRLMSSSSLDSETYFAPKKKTSRNINKSSKWKKKYNKKFVCNCCSKSYKSKTKMVKHLDNHSYIKSKYPFILNNPCRVTIIKFDEKPNSTDLDNTVVYDDEKIFQDAENPLYHVLYIARNSSTKKAAKRFLESSDDERTRSRKIRRISRSSNETVLLEDGNKITGSFDGESPGSHGKTKESKNVEQTECINIDDSDSNTEMDTKIDSSQNAEIRVEFKTIENIITNCKLKYLNKLSQNGNIDSCKKSSTFSESHLKHKILSMGRKILHKDGKYNCTGLLRYMEHKNLEVKWLPKIVDNSSRENLVRIMPKLKSSSDNENLIDKYGWVNIPNVESNKTKITLGTARVFGITESSLNDSSICEVVPSAILTKSQTSETITEVLNSHKSSFMDVKNENSAILYTTDIDVNSKKILNQSPVANPKQLPKKSSNTSESKLVSINVNISETIPNQSLIKDSNDRDNGGFNLSMPIITSTTSLAPLSEEKKGDKEPNIAKLTENNAPRIKVKPVSELMNPPHISNDNQNGIWSVSRFENRAIPAPNVTVGNIIEKPSASAPNLYFQILPQISNIQSVQIPTVERNPFLPVKRVTSEAINASVSRSDYIVLDSVELPNTKTDSPFRYCKDLLLLHNIYLLDPNVNITQDFTNLLKIRVQFKEEDKDKPIALCISLYCWGSSFCISIKNNNNIDIPLTKISARWQWEIFKIFQGDMSHKILNNASRAARSQIFSNTKTFLYLLKSITHKQ